MKKLIAVLLFLGATAAHAQDETVAVSSPAVTTPTAAPAATPPAAQVQPEAPVNVPQLWIDTPYFKGNIPFTQVEVVSLFDLIHKEPLVGAETPIMAIARIQFTGGAVTSISGKGSPIFGAHLTIPNPAPSFVFLNDLKIGGFGGRNFNEGWWMAGLKIGKQIW